MTNNIYEIDFLAFQTKFISGVSHPFAFSYTSTKCENRDVISKHVMLVTVQFACFTVYVRENINCCDFVKNIKLMKNLILYANLVRYVMKVWPVEFMKSPEFVLNLYGNKDVLTRLNHRTFIKYLISFYFLLIFSE